MGRMLFDFRDENFVVTGASSGMGRAVAEAIASAGGRVLAMARRRAKLEGLAAKHPDSIVTAAVDVLDYDEVDAAIEDFVDTHGKVKGLVHAAGTGPSTVLKGWDDVEAHRSLEISFWAGAHLISKLQKRKYSEEQASFVLFSSTSARKGERGLFAYAGGKAAASSLARSLAKELRRGQRINTVCPGWVQTPMTEPYINDRGIIDRHLLGIGEPHDVVPTVLFLISDGARWITGTEVVVDGGYLVD